MSDETLDFIEPTQRGLGIDGRSVVVTPLVMRDLPKLLELASPVFRALSLFDAGALQRFTAGTPNEQDVSTLMGVLSADADEVFAVVAICCREEADWVAGLLPDRFAALMAACIEVNRDFFTRALPQLRAAVARLGRSATPTPSPSS